MVSHVEDFVNDSEWVESFGEKLNMRHFRNEKLHAECDPITNECTIHEDENDPQESISSLVKHLWDSDLGKLVIVGAGIYMANELMQKRK